MLKMMRRGSDRISKNLCKNCHNKNTIQRGKDNKEQYIQYLGGKCCACGYKRCHSALEFHHLDPKEKDPDFASIRYWGLEKAKEELSKCILLCSNCHREEHERIFARRMS